MKRTLSITAALMVALAPFMASAQKLGDHPAIVVQRVQASAGYDYQGKFYPHPAWLYLSAEAPRTNSDHPAVAMFKRDQQERERAAKMASVESQAAQH